MIKRFLVFALVIMIGSVANAAVVWDWTGGDSTSVWETPGNWTVTGTTSYTQPSQQYEGIGPGVDPNFVDPNYMYINDDITAINITNGGTVDKNNEVGDPDWTSSKWTYLGGDNCTLTLNNASTLNTGNDMWTGITATAVTTIDVLGASTLHLGDDFFGSTVAGANTYLNVADGSTFFYNYAEFGAAGTCTVSVTNGSTLENNNYGRIGRNGGTGIVTVDASTIISTGSFYIGEHAGSTGTLNLLNGSTGTFGSRVRLGTDGSTSKGTLTITDSTMTVAAEMLVGHNGTGILTVTGSSLSVGEKMIVARNGGSTGTVTFNDSTLDVTLDIYIGDSSAGTMTLENGTAATALDDIRVGNYGEGTITVNGGSTLDVANYLYVGNSSGSEGTFNASGTNTVITCGTRFAVGYRGTGVANVTAGAKVSSANDLYLGDQSTGHGTLIVSGAGSIVETTGDEIMIGRSTDSWGKATISAGAILSAKDDLYVANSSGSTGTLIVDGADSIVRTLGDDLRIANSGTATATLTNGATITAADEFGIAYSSGSVGTVDVTDSTINSGGRMFVGRDGVGTLNVTNSTINANTDFRVSYRDEGQGTVNLYAGAVLNVGRDFETNAGNNDVLVATINMYDGDVNVGGYMALGDMGQSGAVTLFTIDAGTVDVGLDPVAPTLDPLLDTVVDPFAYIDSLIMGWYDTDAMSDLTINGGLMTIAGEIRFGMLSDHDGVAFDPVDNPMTGTDLGQVRINIDGGTLQAEDLLYTDTITDSKIVLTDGFLKINDANVSLADMAMLVYSGDIVCPNSFQVYTEGDYTVLTVPEPSSLILLALGCLTLLLRRKRS